MSRDKIVKAVAIAALAGAALAAGCASGPFATGASARSDELFSRIQPGMTTDDVRRLLGPPDQTMPFPLSHTVAWDYRYKDTWGYVCEFSVTFDADGRASSTLSWRYDGGDHAS